MQFADMISQLFAVARRNPQSFYAAVNELVANLEDNREAYDLKVVAFDIALEYNVELRRQFANN